MHRATDSKKDIKSKLKFRSTRLRVRDVAFLMVPHIQLNDIILIDSNTSKKLTRQMTYFQAENPHLRIFTVYLLRDPRATLADIKVFKRFYILFDQQVARTCEECVCFVAGVFPR